jgi:galactokinase
MTGAGFGGCAIALVEKRKMENFGKSLIEFYKEKIGYEPEVFASEIGNGVRQVF